MFAADAVSLWRLNQSAPGINYLARSRTVEKAHPPSPYSSSMAQASVRGACGFVLTADSEVNALVRVTLVLYRMRPAVSVSVVWVLRGASDTAV
jgi:hypothetical protein